MYRLLALARPLAILLVAVLVAVFMIKSRPRLEARSVTLPLPIVEVQTVSRGTVPVTVVAHGNVTAWRELEMTAQVAGRVLWKSATFEPGMVVEAGEPLLRIDPTDYRLALAEARQSLSSAELALADAKALRQMARVDEAEAAVAAAQARIERAERDLENTEIVAPYRAVIDEQSVELGQFIAVGARVGRVLGADKAEIRLPIPPQDIGFIDASGDTPVYLYSEGGNGGHRWEGRLARIEARLDPQTRVFPVVVEVGDPLDAAIHGEPLRFGLFVRTEIAGAGVAGSVVIPQAALHGDDDVFLFSGGELARRSVTVARISDGGALVTAGLEDGDRVVVTRLDLMFEGMQVALADE